MNDPLNYCIICGLPMTGKEGDELCECDPKDRAQAEEVDELETRPEYRTFNPWNDDIY